MYCNYQTRVSNSEHATLSVINMSDSVGYVRLIFDVWQLFFENCSYVSFFVHKHTTSSYTSRNLFMNPNWTITDFDSDDSHHEREGTAPPICTKEFSCSAFVCCCLVFVQNHGWLIPCAIIMSTKLQEFKLEVGHNVHDTGKFLTHTGRACTLIHFQFVYGSYH